jgi:hypothetical protein
MRMLAVSFIKMEFIPGEEGQKGRAYKELRAARETGRL